MYKAYVDGACRPNPGKGAFGYIICNFDNQEIIKKNGLVANYTTNNIAEYTAIIKALEAAINIGIKRIAIYSDSALAVNQLNGNYRVKDTNLAALNKKVMKLCAEFNEIIFKHIPREQNRKADKLAEEVLNDKPDNRRARAEGLAQNVFVQTGNGFIFVKDDEYYEINLENNTCTCPDQQNRGGLCKHLMAAELIKKKIERFSQPIFF